MATSLKSKLFAQASVFAPLQALLGTNPFGWYDSQLDPNALATGKAAVVVTQVSRRPLYVNLGQLPTDWTRMQFTIFGAVPDPNAGADSESCAQVAGALSQFMPAFNATGLPGPAPYAQMVSDHDMGLAETQPRTFTRVIDYMVFANNDV